MSNISEAKIMEEIERLKAVEVEYNNQAKQLKGLESLIANVAREYSNQSIASWNPELNIAVKALLPQQEEK